MKWQNLERILAAIRDFVPPLTAARHKGQAGRIAVIGGCREYTGAPFFAAISALKMGADLSHVFCTAGAAPVIKSYSPELIVHPYLVESDNGSQASADRAVADVARWLPRFDCVVVGPGLGRDALLMDSVSQIISSARQQNIPMVIDADGLFLVTQNLPLILSYPLAILTPNLNEYKRLQQQAQQMHADVPPGADVAGGAAAAAAAPCSEEQSGSVQSLALSLGGVTIVEKGPSDQISDGSSVLECSLFGSPRRCGGQGDVLSGSIAVFMAWALKRQQQLRAAAAEEGINRMPSRSRSSGDTSRGESGLTGEVLSENPAVAAAFAGCLLVRRAALAAFEQHRRSMMTTNIIDKLEESVEDLFPLGPEVWQEMSERKQQLQR